MERSEINFNPYLISHVRVNFKQIIALNIKLKTIKFAEKSTRENLCDFGSGKDFLDTAPKAVHKRKKLRNETS